MILDILKAFNTANIAVLKAISVPVLNFDRELDDLCLNMIETMYAFNGAGLAAPQIGINKNIFVMRTEGMKANRRDHIVVINPQKVQFGSDTYVDREGCLSIPGITGDVERAKELSGFSYTTEGLCLPRSFVGLEARIFQHENDHLFGTLFVERASAIYQIKKKVA